MKTTTAAHASVDACISNIDPPLAYLQTLNDVKQAEDGEDIWCGGKLIRCTHLACTFGGS